MIEKLSILTCTILLMVTAATQVFAQMWGGGGYGQPGMWGSGWGWHMVMGPIMMILFIAVIVVIVVLIIRWLGGGTSMRASRSSDMALDILRERYARGEIDDKEYQKRRRELSE